MRTADPKRSDSRWISLAGFCTGIGAIATLWISWCEFPLYAWNDARLLPAFTLRFGSNPYPPLGGGPLTTWIYGPIGVLINLPATWASTVVDALQTAWLINTLVVLGPIGFVYLTCRELSQREWPYRVLALALAVMLVPAPNLRLQVADHAAIAFGLLSLWCLAKPDEIRRTHILWSSALVTLAIWSKQVAVLLPIAHVTYVFIHGRRSLATQFVAWLVMLNFLAAITFGAYFGFSNLWFNCVEVPSRLGWADPVSRLKLRFFAVIGQVVLPSVFLAAIVWIRQWPSGHTAAGRFLRLGMLAYGAMLPLGLIAFFKIGGDTNLLHSWDYLMPTTLLYWLTHRTKRIPASGLPLLGVGIIALCVHFRDFAAIPLRPYTQQFDSAAALTARFPHAIWFPQNPLINYYTDHTFYHTEDGVSTRFLAGYGIHENEFKRYLPTNLKVLAYPSVNTSPFSLPLLPEYSRRQRIPYWVVYERE